MKVILAVLIATGMILFTVATSQVVMHLDEIGKGLPANPRPVVPSPYRLLSYKEEADAAHAIVFVPNETDSQDDILVIQTLARSVIKQGHSLDLTICVPPSAQSPFQEAYSCPGNFFFDVRR